MRINFKIAKKNQQKVQFSLGRSIKVPKIIELALIEEFKTRSFFDMLKQTSV